MSLPFFSADDVKSAVSMQEAIDLMEVAFSSLNNKTAETPLRVNMAITDHDAHHLSMPAYINGGKYLTVKLINVHTNNPSKGADLINGIIVVMDAETGSAIALIDGKSVTALRTGAASGYATKILANNYASTLVVFGNGVQAKAQIEAICQVRDIESVKVIGLTLVAIGTSLPELATTFIAVMRKKAEVVLGNLIGSNIFNLLAIIGITSLISSVPVDPNFIQFDFWVMLAASVLLAPFIFLNIQFNRLSGFLFVALYISYVTAILK